MNTNTNILPPYVKFIKETHGFPNFPASILFKTLLEIPPHTRKITYLKDYRDMTKEEQNQTLTRLKQQNPKITPQDFRRYKEPQSYTLAFPFVHVFISFYKLIDFHPNKATVLFSQKTINSLEEPSNPNYYKFNYSVPAPLPNVYPDTGEFCFDTNKESQKHKTLTAAIKEFLTLFFNAPFNPDIVPELNTSKESIFSLKYFYPNLYPFTKWEQLSLSNPNFIITQLPELIPTIPMSYIKFQIHSNFAEK